MADASKHAKNGFKMFFFILFGIYVFPFGVLVNHFRDRWLALLHKKEKNLGDSLLFTWYLFFYFPHYLILIWLEPFWRDHVSVFKL